MATIRSWNFNSVRVLTTLDLLSADDPESDFGSALQLALEGLAISANLPVGGAADQVLKKLSAADGDAGWATLTMADISDLADELAGKASTDDIVTLTGALSGLASQAAVDTLSASVADKADQSTVDALSGVVDTKASLDDLAAQRFVDLADVDATVTPVEGDAYTYDETLGKQVPTDLNTRFPAADPSTGQTLTENAAPFTLFGFIVNEGDNPPPGLPVAAGVPIIGYERVGTPSMDPVLLDSGSVQNDSALPLTLPALAAGTKFGIALGYSGEATVPDHFDVAVSTGSITVTFTTKHAPNTTAAVVQAEVVVDTDISAASTLTVTAKDVSDVAQARVHLSGAAYQMPNTAAAALDVQKNSAGGSSSSNMSAITAGPTDTDTAQDAEVVIGVAEWSGGSAGTSRTIAGTNGWAEIASESSDNGVSVRNFWVGYLVLDVVGKPQLTTLMTSSDGSTGQWAAQVASFKGV